jgi:hypothetical protein
MPRLRRKGTVVKLSESGESRVNGYLFVLERSLLTFLPRETARDAVREIDSHLRDRLAAADAVPDERAALEKILSELGPPLRVAQAYSLERTVDEAVVTGKIFAIARAVCHVAMSSVGAFFGGFGLFVGYFLGAGFIILAALKPVFPDNIGVWVNNESVVQGLDLAGFRMGGGPSAYRTEHMVGGYWVIPIWLILGLVLLFLTHRSARKFLGWWRRRRSSFTVTVRPAL